MIVVLPLVILDFDEIKHYFKTGEHLAKPTVIDRVEAVRNHPLGPWTERRTIGNCRNASALYHYFKGIHSLKPTNKN
jgi:hypothetical protein